MGVEVDGNYYSFWGLELPKKCEELEEKDKGLDKNKETKPESEKTVESDGS